MIPEQLVTEPAIIKAVKELEKMGLDPVERDLYEREVESAMFDESNRQFYIEEGRAIGVEEGMEKGMEKMLSHMLERRFSTLPDHITQRLDNLTPDQMNELAVAVFDFRGLTDLENWLNSL